MSDSSQSPSPRTESRVRRWAPPALLAALTFAVFVPALFNDFVDWDDNFAIFANPFVRDPSWTSVRWAFSTFLLGHYHPVTWLSLMADHAVWGLSPFGYHLTNILLHAANAGLVYLIFSALLRAAGFKPGVAPATAATLLFAIHPLRVESVAWATERRDVLSGFFLLLTVLFYLRQDDARRAGRAGTKPFALSLVFYTLSLLSKSIGATLPVVLLILDAYPLARLRGGSGGFARWRRAILEKVPYLGLGLVLGIVALVAEGKEGAARAIDVHPLASRLAQAAYGLTFYLKKTLWPTDLSPLYLLEDQLDPWRPLYLLVAAGLVAVTAALLALRRRWPAGLAAWASYVVVVAPVLGLYQVGLQKAADRYTYLPCLAFAALAAGALSRMERWGSARARRAVWAILVALLVAFSWLTVRQCGVWANSVTLWTQAIHVEADNHVAYDHRGQARHKAGDLPGAIRDFDRAIALRSGFADFYVHRGIARLALGEIDAAVADFDTGLRLRPDSALGYLNRAMARMRQGDLPAALRDARAAVHESPRLGEAHNIIGVILDSNGDREGAVAAFDAAIAADPLLRDPYLNRGRLLGKYGRPDSAIADLGAALRLGPPDAALFNDRGGFHLALGHLAGARADFDAAIAIDPRLAYAWLNRCVLAQIEEKFHAAVNDCTAALQIDAGLVEGYLARSEARGKLGDEAGARADVERALHLVPEGSPLRGEIERMLSGRR